MPVGATSFPAGGRFLKWKHFFEEKVKLKNKSSGLKLCCDDNKKNLFTAGKRPRLLLIREARDRQKFFSHNQKNCHYDDSGDGCGLATFISLLFVE